MRYEKPEVIWLSSALDAVRSCGDKGLHDNDSSEGCGGSGFTNGSAYEADE